MNAFLRHFAFEFKTGLRNPSSLMMNYLFPLGFFALMGLVMTKINPLFGQSMVPAMIIFAAMASALLGLPGPQVEAREAGIFRSYKINGVPVLSILGIPALSSIIHIFIASAIIAVTGPVLFGGASPQNWWPFIGVTVIAVFTLAGLGSLIGVVSSNSRSSILWSQLVFLPSMLLGGLMMPASVLPSSVRAISGLLPTTYAMQAYQGLAYGQKTLLDPAASAAILLASGLLAFILAAYLFNWDTRNKARRGHPLMGFLALAPYLVGIALM